MNEMQVDQKVTPITYFLKKEESEKYFEELFQ